MTEINSTPEQVIEELEYVEAYKIDEDGKPIKIRIY